MKHNPLNSLESVLGHGYPKTYLLVGGPMDGQKIDFQHNIEGRRFTPPARIELDVNLDSGLPVTGATDLGEFGVRHERVTYDLHRIVTPGEQVHYIYAYTRDDVDKYVAQLNKENR